MNRSHPTRTRFPAALLLFCAFSVGAAAAAAPPAPGRKPPRSAAKPAAKPPAVAAPDRNYTLFCVYKGYTEELQTSNSIDACRATLWNTYKVMRANAGPDDSPTSTKMFKGVDSFISYSPRFKEILAAYQIRVNIPPAPLNPAPLAPATTAAPPAGATPKAP
jgi:hypothetical protein